MLHSKQEWVRLYLGNLPYALGPLELLGFASKLGYVCERTEIVRDQQSGQSMGFAFLDVRKENADEAIRVMNGQDLGGRTIRVARAKERNR